MASTSSSLYDCYLSGPIEILKDFGVSWRKLFAERIKTKNLPIGIFDPTDKHDPMFREINEDRRRIAEIKEYGSFQEVSKLMKLIRRWDLRAVDKSDFMVAYISKDVPTCGTWDEIVTIERQQKPILVISEKGKMSIPDWSFAIFEEKYLFTSIDECINYIEKVCKNVIELDDKWLKLSAQT